MEIDNIPLRTIYWTWTFCHK